MSGLQAVNRAARAWRATPCSNEPFEFHRSLAAYAPTPLIEVPALASELGVGRVFVKDESARLGLPAFKILGASYAIAKALSRRLGDDRVRSFPELRDALGGTDVRLIAATDGNHGRAVAHVAKLLGIPSVIVIPDGVSEVAVRAIADEGADVRQHHAPYDDVVAFVAAQADDRTVVVQDTSWDGYVDVPQWIVDGYSTLAREVDDQLGAEGIDHPDLVVIPAGVGSFAQAVIEHYRSVAFAPALLVVEPDAAPSVTTALQRGHIVQTPTSDTIMMGLNCGTVSEIAWPALRDGVDVSLTIPDAAAAEAVGALAELGVDAGPCGAATLAGARVAAGDPDLRATLDLGADTVVVLLSTEGRAANPKGGR